MPAVVAHSSRRRRSMSEINMVPFIDVMLVLLIIFMVSAPLITTGIVDLPSVGKARQRAQHVIEVVVGADERLKVRVDQGDPKVVSLSQLATRVNELQAGSADTPVVIAADRNVKYEQVVKVMDVLQRAGIQRVGLAVKQAG
jgi:biopolymer transport protein TolR